MHTLDLFDNKLGVPAMLALGKALSAGGNTTVKSLKLDYNPDIGSKGLAALCDGLMTNSTLEVGPDHDCAWPPQFVIATTLSLQPLLLCYHRVHRYSRWNAAALVKTEAGCWRACCHFQELHSSSLS